MSDAYDRILSSSPVNATAARTMARGVEWKPAIDLHDWYADQPPTRRAIPNPGNPEWRDLTGTRVGRLLVLGVLAKMNAKRPTSWVCRCVCGCFCTRSTRSLKVGMEGGNSFIPECGQCDYQHRLQSGWTPIIKNKPKVKA